MSTKLIPCGNCGETTIPFRTDAELVQFVCGCCGASGPWLHSQKECTEAWNRRFVCLDKNGDKVFAGDEAKATDYTGKVDRLRGIYLKSEDGHLHHVWPSEIELTKEAP